MVVIEFRCDVKGKSFSTVAAKPRPLLRHYTRSFPGEPQFSHNWHHADSIANLWCKMPQLRDPSSSAPGRGTLCSSQAARLRRSLSRYLFRSYRFPALRPTPARRSSDLPIRFRPAFLGLTFLQLILLALLGFHPTLGGQLGVNDKLQRKSFDSDPKRC